MRKSRHVSLKSSGGCEGAFKDYIPVIPALPESMSILVMDYFFPSFLSNKLPIIMLSVGSVEIFLEWDCL